MKKLITLFILLLICGLVKAQFGGSGTSGDPYLINSANQMASLAIYVNSGTNYSGKYFLLQNNIDLSAYPNWTPIGTSSYPFNGTFDGNGHKITNLTINTTGTYIGLFGNLSGTIKNLGLENVNITSTLSYVGGLAGKVSGTITNCYVTSGTITGGNYVGGVCGYINSGSISQCWSSGLSITGDSYVGGLGGYTTGSAISNCYSESSVLANVQYAGGLIGFDNSNGSIVNCYSNGHVNTGSYKGGLVGYGSSPTATNSFWDNQTSYVGDSYEGTGKSTTLMKTLSTFTGAGWDFVTTPIWKIDAARNNGYPFLAWQVLLPIEVTATMGTTGPIYYSNLKAAFDAINLGTHKGVITVKIEDNTIETASAVLNASSGSSNYFSINIYPTATGLSISGNLATPLIDLNGADNVTIDGRVYATGSTKDLVISNTSASNIAGTSTIRLINDASSNIVKYCTIKGSTTNAASGILFFSSGTTTGNISNTIDNNNITNAADANRPLNAVYSSGTSGALNSGNTVSNNNIYDFLNRGTASNGINLNSNTTAWTISGNSFYETATFVPTADVQYTGINVYNLSGTNFMVSGNNIGGSSAGCGGTAWTKTNAFSNVFYGILLSVGTGIASNIQGNIIKNTNFSNAWYAYWYGIDVTAGDVNIGTTAGNTIGATTGTGSIVFTNAAPVEANFYAIGFESPGISDIENNQIGAITVVNSSTYAADFYGITKTATTGNTTINNNVIGSTTTANSINASSASTTMAQTVYGIYNAGSGTATISGNTIANLNNAITSPAGSVAGVYYNGSTTASIVSGNFINSLTASGSGSTATVYGIQIAGGLTTYSDNIISLGGNSPTTIYGIYEKGAASNNNNLYFNTVYLGGVPTTGTLNSYALYSAVTTNTRDFRNNIFDNSRSNSGTATGKHYAAFFNYAVSTNLTLDYNDYYAAGIGRVLGWFNSSDVTSWPIISGFDAHSFTSDPVFASAGGTTATNYLPSVPTLIAATGTGITTDYAIISRSLTLPSMGAYEYAVFPSWTGRGSDLDWNNSLNWSNGAVPIAADNIILPNVTNKPVVSLTGSVALCHNLNITSGGVLTIAPGKALTVGGTLTNNSTAGVVIQSDATGTGSLIAATSSGSGTAITQHWMSAGSWHLVSSTVVQTVSNFLTANANVATNSSSFRGMMDYNPLLNSWNTFFLNATDNGSVGAGRGFSLRLAGLTPGTNDAAVTFTGTLQAGTQSVSGLSAGYWNCIGNPYSSAIGITGSSSATAKFLTVNTANLNSSYVAIYLWDNVPDAYNGQTGHYTAINNTYHPYNDIQQGQAFMVYMNNSGISFTPDMQIHAPALLLKSSQTVWPTIKLVAAVNDQTTATIIAFNSNMTKGLDPGYDAGLLKGGADLLVYTKLVQDNGIPFSIQALPDNDFTNMVIPIGLDFKTGGEVTFSSQLTNLPANCRAILEDKLTKTFTDLSTDVYKTTIAANSSIMDRFFLHTSNSSGVNDKLIPDKLTAYANHNIEIHLTGQVSNNAVATLYDVHGRIILVRKLEEGNSNIIPTPNIKTGIYLLSVKDNGKLNGLKIIVTE